MTAEGVATHVIAHLGDRRSLCGVKKPLPVVWARFVDAHVEGHGMIICRDCRPLIDGTPPSDG